MKNKWSLVLSILTLYIAPIASVVATDKCTKVDSIYLPSRIAFNETDSAGVLINKIEFKFSSYGKIAVEPKKKISVTANYYNEFDRKVATDTFSIVVNKNSIKVDPSMLLNYRSNVVGVTVKNSGAKLDFPLAPSAGQDLEEKEIKYRVFDGAKKIAETEITVANREVKSMETLSVAGFLITDAYKINARLEMKHKNDGKETSQNNRLIVWFSPQYGFLKVEEKNARNKLIRKMEFTQD